MANLSIDLRRRLVEAYRSKKSGTAGRIAGRSGDRRRQWWMLERVAAPLGTRLEVDLKAA